jgi:hypothetical protein
MCCFPPFYLEVTALHRRISPNASAACAYPPEELFPPKNSQMFQFQSIKNGVVHKHTSILDCIAAPKRGKLRNDNVDAEKATGTPHRDRQPFKKQRVRSRDKEITKRRNRLQDESGKHPQRQRTTDAQRHGVAAAAAAPAPAEVSSSSRSPRMHT